MANVPPDFDLDLSHLEPGAAARVRMTVSCRDTDRLPKVPGAGEIFDHDGTRVQRMFNGLLIEEGCYYGPWMTDVITGLAGHHEPQEEVVFDGVLERLLESEPDASMIELGSFWAFYSMSFRQRAGAANVIVDMEPDPAYLEVGKRNFALNGLESLFLHGAIGSSPGETVSFTTESTGELIEVEQYDIASLMKAGGIDRVGLLMVDIQGFETPLLTGAIPLLRSGAVRFIIVSTHHHVISGDALTHQNVLKMLKDAGGHVIAEHTVGESFSGDGLVAVSFDARDEGFTIDVSHARYGESLFGEVEYDLDRAFAERDAAQVEVARLTRQLEKSRRSARRAKRALRDVHQSRSWRLTRPIRAVTGLARRR